jgi:maltose O-acetyltransferase
MQKLRSLWWALREELKGLSLVLLAALPAQTGVRIRAFFMPLMLGRVGKKTVFHAGLAMTNMDKISVGSHCVFGQRLLITGGGGVQIGDWVGFGPDVKVWSVNHRFDDPNEPWQLQGWEKKAVVIEDDVSLGANVFVMPGITIGKGAIVRASAVVAKSIPSYAIVAGNPGRIVGWRKRPPGLQGAAPDSAGSD